MAQANKDMRMRVEHEGEITRITFLDRNILEESTIQQIGEEVGRLIELSDNTKLLISFENVEHLSSAALGAMITIHNKVKFKGGQLRLSNIDPQIYEVFVITKLNRLFQIFETVAEAAGSFR